MRARSPSGGANPRAAKVASRGWHSRVRSSDSTGDGSGSVSVGAARGEATGDAGSASRGARRPGGDRCRSASRGARRPGGDRCRRASHGARRSGRDRCRTAGRVHCRGADDPVLVGCFCLVRCRCLDRRFGVGYRVDVGVGVGVGVRTDRRLGHLSLDGGWLTRRWLERDAGFALRAEEGGCLLARQDPGGEGEVGEFGQDRLPGCAGGDLAGEVGIDGAVPGQVGGFGAQPEQGPDVDGDLRQRCAP